MNRKSEVREILIDILVSSIQPLSAGEILELVSQKRKVNKTTIYRDLDRLVGDGEVTKFALKAGKHHYELANKVHHHHLLCTVCDKVMDVECEGKEKTEKENLAVIKNEGFKIESVIINYQGLCPECTS